MKVHVLQHMPNEGPGSIAPWLEHAGATVSFTHFYQSTALPDPRGFNLIIALGGPMSVNDETVLPWLVAEKQFLRDAMACGTAVLGICLGAQLIASALGARVYPNAQKEIGWFPVTGLNAGEGLFQFPAVTHVFHWHGETFDLPPGAIQLARSAACENQAFQLGNNVIGLQFHLETDPASAKAFVDADNAEPAEKRELVAGKPYIQSEEQMLTVPAEHYAAINALMAKVLTYLFSA
jgi:GMP synthase-like glutamine amidotransferase